MTIFDFADKHWLVSLIIVLAALGTIDIVAKAIGGKYRSK